MTSRQFLAFQLFMLFTPLTICQCQQPPTAKAPPIVMDKNPEFKGGSKALFRYLSDNVKYPELARISPIEGTVYVHFIVEPDGQVTNVEVARGIGEVYNQEAVRVVQSMSGMWESGLNQGLKVRMPFSLPVKFKLE
jgi:periplasmic protein TonB